jgi:hypothetical protein
MKIKLVKLILLVFLCFIIGVYSQLKKSNTPDKKKRFSSSGMKKNGDTNKNVSSKKTKLPNIIVKDKVQKSQNKKPGQSLYSDSSSFSYLSAFDRKHNFFAANLDFDSVYKNRYVGKKKK